MKKSTLAALILAASQMALAADWSFYGSARFTTFRNTWQGDAATNIGDSNMVGVQNNSRFGAKVSDTAKKVSGLVELGFNDGNSIRARRLFGVWDATPNISVLVGQEWSLINFNHSNQVWNSDNLMYGQGAFTETRVEQVRVTAYGASVALVKGGTASMSTAGGNYTATSDNPPKIEAAYTTKVGAVELAVGGGWYGYTVMSLAPKGKNKDNYDIASFVAAADLGTKIDVVGIGASFGFAQNPAEFGLKHSTPKVCRVSPDAAGDLQNDQALIGSLIVNAKLGRYTPEIGLGLESHAKDKASALQMASYLQVSVALAKGVSIVPEVGMVTGSVDNGTTKDDMPTLAYFGAKSQISF